MSWSLISGICGLVGSLLLAVPAITGLKDRKAIDQAKALYELDKAKAAKLEDAEEKAKAEARAWTNYKNRSDAAVAAALGQWQSHRVLNLIGICALALSFIALILHSS